MAELWAQATLRQRSAATGGGVVLAVLAALASLEPVVLPVTVAVVVAEALVLARFRTQARRRRHEDRRIAEEAARGVRAMERWLASGENA